MAFDLSKFINLAREFKKNNPNADVHDFLDTDNFYQSLPEHDKKFALKKIIKVFESSTPADERTSVEAVQLSEELK